jgi:hypothetical protein
MIHAQLPELIKILSKELSLPFNNGILRKSKYIFYNSSNNEYLLTLIGGLPPPQQFNLNFELSE